MIDRKTPLGVVVDATNQITVNYKAGKGNVETATFIRQLEAIERTCKPQHLIAAFDSPDSYRKTISLDYKSNRPPKDLNLVKSLKLAKDRAMDAGWIIAEIQGFEADDVLASFAKTLSDRGDRVLLVSRDKDLNQCLRAGLVTICKKVTSADGPVDFLTASDCQEKFGVDPDQWIGYQTLIGDAGDNIKGVDGIGPKTAAKLIRAAGDVEKVFRMPEISGSQKLTASIKRFVSRSETVRQLVTLRDDLPVADYLR